MKTIHGNKFGQGAALAALLVLGACKSPGASNQTSPEGTGASSHNGGNNGTNTGATNGGSNAAAVVPAMSDGEIVAVLAAADAGEIQVGTLAQTQATDERARTFAR